VPPTPVTSGSVEGQSTDGDEEQQITLSGSAQPDAGSQMSSVEPWSPLAASTVTPWLAALRYAERSE